MRFLSFMSAVTIFALGACSHYSEDLASLEGKVYKHSAPVQMAAAPYDISPAAGGAFYSGETLNHVLAREYFELAKYENEKAYDYKAAKQFTKKAKQASEGKLVVPFKLSDFNVPSSQAAELTQARAELISALKIQNMPENHAALAKAQTSFDCWVERTEEAIDEAHYASCRDEFRQSMAVLTSPAAGVAGERDSAGIYNLGFAPNVVAMDLPTAQMVETLAQFLTMPENESYTADVTGYLKTQGAFGVNIVNERLALVRNILINRGVDASRIKVSAAPAAEVDAQPDMQIYLNAPQDNAAWQ